MFTIDYNAHKPFTERFERVPAGTYEVLVEGIGTVENENGKKFEINFKIRSDFQQPMQGSLITERWFANKQTGEYHEISRSNMMAMLSGIAKLKGVQDGQKFKDFDDYVNFLIGTPILLTIDWRDSKPNAEGRTFPNLVIQRMEPSKAAAAPSNVVGINEADLPF
ncbi:MAG: DUF669 domain-containing protein [Turicibacter sp.]|nr:DUF669 domain-containing protein [Turicibacter sp.]